MTDAIQKDKHIILIGMMGSGKSCVGRELSARTGRPFMDTDAMVEGCYRKRIAEIFETEGEERFRQSETFMIERAIGEPEPSVIATGGGAVLREGNRSVLWGDGCVFYLRASPEDLMARLYRDRGRPLLQNQDPLGTLRSLMEQRSVFYEQAHSTVDVGGRSVGEIADEILRRYRELH